MQGKAVAGVKIWCAAEAAAHSTLLLSLHIYICLMHVDACQLAHPSGPLPSKILGADWACRGTQEVWGYVESEGSKTFYPVNYGAISGIQVSAPQHAALLLLAPCRY